MQDLVRQLGEQGIKIHVQPSKHDPVAPSFNVDAMLVMLHTLLLEDDMFHNGKKKVRMRHIISFTHTARLTCHIMELAYCNVRSLTHPSPRLAHYDFARRVHGRMRSKDDGLDQFSLTNTAELRRWVHEFDAVAGRLNYVNVAERPCASTVRDTRPPNSVRRLAERAKHAPRSKVPVQRDQNKRNREAQL